MAEKPRGTKSRSQSRAQASPRSSAGRTPNNKKKKKAGQTSSLKTIKRNIAKSLKKNTKLPVIFTAIILCIILFIVISLFTNKNAFSITVDNEQVCVIKKDKKVDHDELVNMAVEMIEIDMGTKIKVNETVSFVPVHANKKEMLSPDTAITKIASSITYQVQALAIKVDNRVMATVKNMDEYNTVKMTIAEPYVPEDAVIADIDFLEDVVPEVVYVEKDAIHTVEQAVSLLTVTNKASESYTVVSGDSLSIIAGKTGMSIDELLKVNPNHSFNSVLRVGEELNLTVDKPVVSIVTYEEITYTEVVPKETVQQENASQPKSYTRAVQYGSDGQDEVTAYRVRVNGIEDASMQKEISRRTIVEPVPEIIEVGIK